MKGKKIENDLIDPSHDESDAWIIINCPSCPPGLYS